jgi:hypothetical protein
MSFRSGEFAKLFRGSSTLHIMYTTTQQWQIYLLAVGTLITFIHAFALNNGRLARIRRLKNG